jgi:hypothetical protein
MTVAHARAAKFKSIKAALHIKEALPTPTLPFAQREVDSNSYLLGFFLFFIFYYFFHVRVT